MTGEEIRIAYANHLPIKYHHKDGGSVLDIVYRDIFSVSYIIKEDIDRKGKRHRIFTTCLTLNDRCWHSQSTVCAKDCELENPSDIDDCDYIPNIKLPKELYTAFIEFKPITAKINGKEVFFPHINKLEIFLQTNCELLIICTVGEHFDLHEVPVENITFI